MAFTYATLDGDNLPPQFSYQPYTASKRQTMTQTANSVVVQTSDPQYIAGDDVITWTIEAAYPTEWQTLAELYFTTTPSLYSFTGYWGDHYTVLFWQLDQPSVRGRVFDISGSFRIMTIISLTTATCSS